MQSIEEKRVYGDRGRPVEAYVASSMGVVRVRIAGETVGEFSLCARCDARDVAASDRTVAVATDADVRVLDASSGADRSSSEAGRFAETGFGPATAVGYDADALLAGDSDGRVARRSADGWESLGRADGRVTAIDGSLVGAEGGVYRLRGDGLEHAGLDDVRDVSAAGVPLVATATGLSELGNGWLSVHEGAFDAVAADPRTAGGRLERAHAVADGTLYAYHRADDEWRAVDDDGEASGGDDGDANGGDGTDPGAGTDPVVDVAYGETVYAVTEGGEIRVAADDGGWRTRALGVRDVRGIAASVAGD